MVSGRENFQGVYVPFSDLPVFFNPPKPLIPCNFMGEWMQWMLGLKDGGWMQSGLMMIKHGQNNPP